MRPRSVVGAVLVLVAACGGKVVFETADPDQPGQPDLKSDCTALCEATSAAGCGSSSSCESDCDQLIDQVGNCEQELAAMLRCIASELATSGSCDPSAACLAELQDFGFCFAQGAGSSVAAGP